MSTSKLTKWGNSQGVVIPKKLCETMGFRIGDELNIAMNPRTGKVEITPQKRAAAR